VSLALASSAFLDGYRLALSEEGEIAPLVSALLRLEPLSRPFAFEGVALGCRLLDERDDGERTTSFISSAEPKWGPLIRLGIGCALARLRIDPPDDDMILDGYGFQLGLAVGVARTTESAFHAEIGRGRALWFVTGGRGHACARVIQGARSAGALWRGVGTACAFAGDPLSWAGRLRDAAGGFEDDVTRGVRDGVELWCSLEGSPPDRTIDVERALTR
jgi:hypothetical protein